MAQIASVLASPRLRSCVIAHRREFDSLFESFDRLQAISYVVSPDLLLHFFEKRGLSEVEVVVGENLTEQYRQALDDWFEFEVGRPDQAATGAPQGGLRFPISGLLGGRLFESFYLDVGAGDPLPERWST